MLKHVKIHPTQYLLYCDLAQWDGEQVGLAVDDEAFRSDGGDGVTMLLAGSDELTLVVAGKPILLPAGAVTDNFSRLPAMSEQKLASDEDDATQSSLLAVEAFVRLLFANDSTS